MAPPRPSMNLPSIIMLYIIFHLASTFVGDRPIQDGGDTGQWLPSLNILLSPIAFGRESIALSCTMVLNNLDPSRFKANQPLLTLKLADGPTPTARYDEDNAIHASDDAGTLQLFPQDVNDVEGPRKWLLSRDPDGPVTVKFTAPYRETNSTTPPGPRIDLRRDPGGALVGMGMGFIPVPPNRDDQPEEARQDQWSVTIDWDIRSEPSYIYAATSLGDSFPYTKTGNPYDLITRNIFAVGHLHRFPSWDADPSPSFAIYWSSDPPWDISDLTHRASGMVKAITTYFNSSEPFHVFLRKSTSGHGGTGATSSFLLEYSDGSEDEITAHDMGFTLAHEAVHEFALMEPTKPGEWEWYVEGVASYIGAVAAYRQAGWGREDMIQALKDYAQAYYTSPVVGLGMGYVVEHAWENIHIMRVIYFRGVMFLAVVSGLISDATGGEKGVEDIVMELYRRRSTLR